MNKEQIADIKNRLKGHFIDLALTAMVCLMIFVSSLGAQVVEPPKKQPVSIVPSKIDTVGGKLICIDASKAKGDVIFDVDKAIESAIMDGKKLYICVPKHDEAKCYHVGVISWDDKTRDLVKINVPGDKAPVDPPDPTKAILERLDKIETNQSTMVASQAAMIARLVALEQIKPQPPPVPADPFVAAVQAAYEKDGRPAAALASLTAVYRQSGSTVSNAAKASDVLAQMHTAAQSLIADQLPTVRRFLADDSNAVIGRTDKALDAASRAVISAQFLKIQKALEGVK